MPASGSIEDVLRNMLQHGELSFLDYVELVLYHPQFGYYAKAENPIGRGADYVTAPALSPVFAFGIGNLVREFLSRTEGVLSSIVDIGCGDGSLIRAIASQIEGAKFFGVDRSMERTIADPNVTYVRTLDELPRDGAHLFFSNELYDAFPFARLVKRGEHMHELFVHEHEGALDWMEHEAAAPYDDYFAERGIELAEGQFADVALEWEAFHADVARFLQRGLIVTIDYGFEAKKLFHPRARRFGTAAAYRAHHVSRDLLASPGEQDLTAHINFTDLERAGTRNGATTLFFDRLAKFLLAIGVTEHELFRPAHDVPVANADEAVQMLEAREDARRLVLPDGIGEEMRVLVQAKNVPLDGWSFQRSLFR